MPMRRTFNLTSLFGLITVSAIVLTLIRWLGLLQAVPLAAVPFSLIFEWLFAPPRQPLAHDSGRCWAFRSLATILCALPGVVAMWVGLYAPMARWWSPGPLLSFLPFLAFRERQRLLAFQERQRLLEMGVFEQFSPVMALLALFMVPVAMFLVLHFDLFRRTRSSGIPLRFAILLAIATGFSIWWLAGGRSWSFTHQGVEYRIAVTAANVNLMLALWTGWFLLHAHAKTIGRLAFGVLLHVWLFWIAFPWLFR